MIYLTRLNGDKIVINVDLIELLEQTPDTIVTLTTGRKYVVKESMEIIQAAIINYHRAINTALKK